MPEFSLLMNKVRKSYPGPDVGTDILRDISFKAYPFEFICVMGSTGCGKTTLMRILSGIERPGGGQFYFYKSNASEGIPRRLLQNLGVVFQSDNLLEWRTVYENVRLPLEIFGGRKGKNTEKTILELLTLVGLQDYRDCYPKELSGGMRQRCAIARSLAHSPDLLLLDQPFGALDAITRKTLNLELLRLWKERKKTVIMVTNSVNEALTLATRVLVLSPAPASIVGEVYVTLSYEERTHDLLTNPKFLTLRGELEEMVRSQSETGGLPS